MAKLRPGAVLIDLPTGGVYGDIDHCPLQDLLESAEAMYSLLPRVQHRGLWGLSKAYDADCYLYTADKRYQPPKGLNLEARIDTGVAGMPPCRTRASFMLLPIHSERESYYQYNTYHVLVGSVRDGLVSTDIEGIPDLTAEGRARAERLRPKATEPKPQQMEMSL